MKELREADDYQFTYMSPLSVVYMLTGLGFKDRWKKFQRRHAIVHLAIQPLHPIGFIMVHDLPGLNCGHAVTSCQPQGCILFNRIRKRHTYQ